MTGSAVLDLVQHAAELAAATGQAPSLHNAQPWRLRVRAEEVQLYADRSRALPVADPSGRQLHLGVGAALFALRLALADLNVDHDLELLPDPSRPDLVARLRAVGQRERTPAEAELHAQLPHRRTVRTRFTDDPVPVPVRVLLADHAAAESASLRWLETAGERRSVADLVSAAERRQQADPAYRAELTRWTGAETLATGAGVPPASFGASAAAGHSAAFPLRDFAGGRNTAVARPASPLEEHPVVAVLWTDADQPADWLAGGQALLRMLLAATAQGLVCSQLNQPIEFPALRQLLRDELRLPGWPQVILRLGYPAGPLPPAPPRRPTHDVLLP